MIGRLLKVPVVGWEDYFFRVCEKPLSLNIYHNGNVMSQEYSRLTLVASVSHNDHESSHKQGIQRDTS